MINNTKSLWESSFKFCISWWIPWVMNFFGILYPWISFLSDVSVSWEMVLGGEAFFWSVSWWWQLYSSYISVFNLFSFLCFDCLGWGWFSPKKTGINLRPELWPEGMIVLWLLKSNDSNKITSTKRGDQHRLKE